MCFIGLWFKVFLEVVLTLLLWNKFAGWTPQTFTSSRKKRAEIKQQDLSNFLDEDEKAVCVFLFTWNFLKFSYSKNDPFALKFYVNLFKEPTSIYTTFYDDSVSCHQCFLMTMHLTCNSNLRYTCIVFLYLGTGRQFFGDIYAV